MSSEEFDCCYEDAPITLCQKAYQLVALGDSIALSTTPPSPRGSYVDTFVETWNNCYTSKMTLKNFAVDGNTSSELCQSLQTPKIVKAIQQATIITINIGGNDIVHAYKHSNSPLTLLKRFNCIQEQFLTNLETILVTIRSYNPDVLIFVNGLYNPLPIYGFIGGILKNYLNKWNCCLRTTTEDHDAIYIPTQRILAQCSKKFVLSPDKIHLSPEGANLLAEAYLHTVRSCR